MLMQPHLTHGDFQRDLTHYHTSLVYLCVLRAMGKTPTFIQVDEGGELANSNDFCKTQLFN
jgi:hypothetical protein